MSLSRELNDLRMMIGYHFANLGTPVTNDWRKDELFKKIDDLEKYDDTDKPWCEYDPETQTFLIEWEDEEYHFKKPVD